MIFISEVETEEYTGLALMVGKPVANLDDFEADFVITDIEEKKEEED